MKQQPDTAILEDLVDRWQDRLFRFAYMRIGIREDAEDLIQDVFISVFNMMRDGKEIKDPGHYLMRSISNACASYQRRNPPQQISLDRIPEYPAEEQDRDIHSEYLRITRLLDGLPAEQAEILRMKCYDSLTFREIAGILGIPEPTAKSRYRYAIQNLQQKLKSHPI